MLFRPEVLVFMIPIVAIICGTIISLSKSKQKSSASLSEEETKLMQDLYKSLEKMEKRVEALETIIINKK